MTTPGTPPLEASSFGAWLARRAALLALRRDANYRRNGLAITAIALRRAVDWRTALAFLVFPALVSWILIQYVADPRTGFFVVMWLHALAAAGAGATILGADLRQGTLELLWLATGSERAMLALRLRVAAILLAALGALMVLPLAALPAGQGINLLGAWLMLTTTAWFILAVMVWLSTWFPQAWTAGLVGLLLLGSWAWFSRESFSMLYPFLNPFGFVATPGGGGATFVTPDGVTVMMGGQEPGGPKLPQIILNRIFFILVARQLLGAAAGRLRRVFPG